MVLVLCLCLMVGTVTLLVAIKTGFQVDAKKRMPWRAFAPIVAATLLCICFFGIAALDFYRKGQIDALTGKVRYQLVEQEDKSVQWEEIDD